MNIPQQYCDVNDCNILRAGNTTLYCPKHKAAFKKYGDAEHSDRVMAEIDRLRSLRAQQASTFRSWRAMKNRCLNEKAVDYNRYGGRGVTICDDWLGQDGYESFYRDMGDRPTDMTLDRIDGDKGYSPENCRWADATTQSRNQSRWRKNGYRGVRKVKDSYVVTLKVAGKEMYRKNRPTFDLAVLAREYAESVYWTKDEA